MINAPNTITGKNIIRSSIMIGGPTNNKIGMGPFDETFTTLNKTEKRTKAPIP